MIEIRPATLLALKAIHAMAKNVLTHVLNLMGQLGDLLDEIEAGEPEEVPQRITQPLEEIEKRLTEIKDRNISSIEIDGPLGGGKTFNGGIVNRERPSLEPEPDDGSICIPKTLIEQIKRKPLIGKFSTTMDAEEAMKFGKQIMEDLGILNMPPTHIGFTKCIDETCAHCGLMVFAGSETWQCSECANTICGVCYRMTKPCPSKQPLKCKNCSALIADNDYMACDICKEPICEPCGLKEFKPGEKVYCREHLHPVKLVSTETFKCHICGDKVLAGPRWVCAICGGGYTCRPCQQKHIEGAAHCPRKPREAPPQENKRACHLCGAVFLGSDFSPVLCDQCGEVFCSGCIETQDQDMTWCKQCSGKID